MEAAEIALQHHKSLLRVRRIESHDRRTPQDKEAQASRWPSAVGKLIDAV